MTPSEFVLKSVFRRSIAGYPTFILMHQAFLIYAAAQKALILIDEPARFFHRADASQADFLERDTCFAGKRPDFPPRHSLLPFNRLVVSRRLDQIKPVIALSQIQSSGNGLPDARSLIIQSRPSDGYRGREEALTTTVGEWIQSGNHAVIFAGSENRQKRLGDRFREQGIAPRILQNNLSRGFVWPEARLLVLGTHDIFGAEKKHRKHRAEKGLKIDLFSDLVPGERVVHDDHGIGRYEGLVNLNHQGIRRDYLKIVYAGNDTLYIPMESLDQIQKYVGADGREPKLSKLGGQEWNRMKERARSSIRQLATDLIQLYAERSARKGISFSPPPPPPPLGHYLAAGI